jgi:hypothetical protein
MKGREVKGKEQGTEKEMEGAEKEKYSKGVGTRIRV